jgi:Mn2+/Fe2+ NRAMP family transporter
MNIRPSSDQIKQPERPKLADIMGPGLITGASDDDPSGIATYSQAGTQFGYSLVGHSCSPIRSCAQSR